MTENRSAVAWGQGGGHKGTFWGDQNVLYFNFGRDYMTVTFIKMPQSGRNKVGENNSNIQK